MSSIQEQIAEIEREIRMRRGVYGNLVRNGAKSKDEADRQVALMQDVLATLIKCAAADRGVGREKIGPMNILQVLIDVTNHFSDVMRGWAVLSDISGAGVTFKDGVEEIPTIAKARQLIRDLEEELKV